MSTTKQKSLGSVVEWAGTLLGWFVASSLVVGFLVVVASSPALLTLPLISDLAASFGWLTIAGLFLPFLNPSFSEDDAELLSSLLENVEEASRVERFLYLISFLLILVCSLSALTFVIAIAAAFLTAWTNVGLLGVGVAIFYPAIDIWAGNRLGWNIASTGGLIAVLVLYLAALGYQTNTTIPWRAATDARSFILSHQKRM